MADELKTQTVKGVPILAVGEWEGQRGGRQKYTREDLEEMAAAHAEVLALGAYAPIWLGHTSDNPDLPEPPSVGYLGPMRVEGDQLVADLTDVPAQVARLLNVKAYRGRSIEGFRTRVSHAIEIGGKRFRQVITGLALLGRSLPAVDTLDDIERLYIAAGSGDEPDLVLFPFTPLAAARADTADDRETAIKQALAAMDALEEMVVALVAGRRDAPIVRTRMRALRQDFRRIASTGLVANQRSDDVDLKKVASALGLEEGADMNAVLGAIVQNAGVTDPNTALAVIAEILGMPGAEPDGIIAKIRELSGGGEAPPEEEGELPAEPAMLAKPTQQGGSDPAVTVLSKQVTELLRWKAGEEGRRVVEQAEGLVDRAIAAGKFVPAQRETLVALAKHDAKAFGALAESQPTSVAFGEKGSAGGPELGGEPTEPTKDELRVAAAMGLTEKDARAMLRNRKRVAQGLDPEDPEDGEE